MLSVSFPLVKMRRRELTKCLVLVDAASAGSGHSKKYIDDEEARSTYEQVGSAEKGWLGFQGYYDEILVKTNGSFLK